MVGSAPVQALIEAHRRAATTEAAPNDATIVAQVGARPDAAGEAGLEYDLSTKKAFDARQNPGI